MEKIDANEKEEETETGICEVNSVKFREKRRVKKDDEESLMFDQRGSIAGFEGFSGQ